MADNTQVNNGTGDTIRDKDRAGVKTQVVVVDVTDGAATEVLGVGADTVLTQASAGLTTATTAYTAGDQLGTELTVASVFRTGRGATIVSACLIDKAKVIGAVDAFLFSVATTPAADNAANAWSDADMLLCQGVIHLNDVIASANNYIALATNLPFVVKPGSGTSLFVDLVTRSGHTFFGAAGDLTLVLGVIPA